MQFPVLYASPIDHEHWGQIHKLMSLSLLDGVSLVETFFLKHSHLALGANRIFPRPLAIYDSLNDAKLAAREIRQKGRSFKIERIPMLKLDFGRYSFFISVCYPFDLKSYKAIRYASKENLIQVDFSPRKVLIPTLRFRDIEPELKRLSESNKLLMGAIGFGQNHQYWMPWTREEQNHWISYVQFKALQWVAVESYMVDYDYAESFAEMVLEDFNYLINSTGTGLS